MPVELFPDGQEPEDLGAVIWRFMEQWKFRDLIETGELFFNRADRFPQDEAEGLPPEEYQHVLSLNPKDLHDAQEFNHSIGSIAQIREGFYINCWLLIPMKVVGDSDLIPVTGSEVKPIVFGAKRRWRSYPA